MQVLWLPLLVRVGSRCRTKLRKLPLESDADETRLWDGTGRSAFDMDSEIFGASARACEWHKLFSVPLSWSVLCWRAAPR